MSERGRGRGRSQGRARGQDERRYQQEGPSQQFPPLRGSSSTGAWARRPGPSQPGPSHQQAPYAKPEGHSGGRAVQRIGGRGDGGGPGPAGGAPQPMEVEPLGAGQGAAGPAPAPAPAPAVAGGAGAGAGGAGGNGGGDAVALGRGAMRGRRALITAAEALATRPKNLASKLGKSGNAVRLQANYFKLLATTDWCLYQYRVDFAPEEDRTAFRKGLLRVHEKTLGVYIFDGTVLYTSNRLPQPLEVWSQRQSDEAKIRITIRLVGDMRRGDHHYIQFFNIIMRKCLELLKLQLVGREYYDARSKVEVPEYRLELWPGYLTSIRQHERDILMCAEISHKVMRQQTLLDILQDCYNDSQRQGKDFRSLYAERVGGCVVLTDYNNNTYRVDGVDFNVNPNSTFPLRSGEQISYKDYYNNKYQIRIRNDTQPMLLARTKPKDRRAGQAEMIYLVPELCRATGLTDDMRNHFQLMKALATHTRVAPDSRIHKLIAFNRRLRSEESIVKELRAWNLQLDDRLTDVPGRVLQSEKIVLANMTVSGGQFGDWTKGLQTNPLFKTTTLSNWVVVCTGRAKRNAQGFVRMIMETSRGINCRVDEPRYFELRDDRAGTYAETLEMIMSRSSPELIFCIVSNNRPDRYSVIKKKCLVDRPVPSQVFLEKNLTAKTARSIATKVSIQLNCKLGGAPWSIELPKIDLMVIGFDVCHDTESKSRDYGAMVASINRSLTRYFSAVSRHDRGEELSNELSLNVEKALQVYRQCNQTLPSHILIYRDGVGEGQIPQVFSHEVEQVRKKLLEIYGDPSLVKMAFVIVTKRINTRFFQDQRNPPPGTVVDDVVTNPMKYDFFIVSQSVREGTVSPTAYSVIADTIGWSPDQIQRMTYKLCHMYFNCTKTVRVPAPCQYAHKLAFLVSQAVHRPPNTQMETLLYYL